MGRKATNTPSSGATNKVIFFKEYKKDKQIIAVRRKESTAKKKHKTKRALVSYPLRSGRTLEFRRLSPQSSIITMSGDQTLVCRRRHDGNGTYLLARSRSISRLSTSS
jgi:hypothetical protein